MNPSERGLPNGVELLRFSFRGESAEIPVAPNAYYLGQAIRERVIPGLSELETTKRPGQIVGIGFLNYFYSSDAFDQQNQEATQQLIQLFRSAGLTVADKPKKLDPIAPERYSLLSEMRQRDDYYHLLDDFLRSTYIIGPVAVEPIEREPYLYDYVREVEASRLIMPASVAIHGEALLADFPIARTVNEAYGDRIYSEEIVSMLDRIASPAKLA